MDVFAELQRLGSLIRQLQGALGGKTIACGTATLTFAASTSSNNVTVTHGLGRTPTAIVATSLQAGAFGQIANCNAHTVGATTFGLNGESKTSFTGTTTVSWVAIG